MKSLFAKSTILSKSCGNPYGKGCRIGTMYENAFFLVFRQSQIYLMRIFWAFHYLSCIVSRLVVIWQKCII